MLNFTLLAFIFLQSADTIQYPRVVDTHQTAVGWMGCALSAVSLGTTASCG